MRKNGKRTAALVVLFSMLALMLVSTGGAQAATSENGIILNAIAGFKGSVKQDEWYPVKLSLTNSTDEDLKGELVISYMMQSTQATSDIIIPVDLPMGSVITLSASIPGDMLNANNNKIRYFQGSFKSGKSIRMIGNDFISTNGMSSSTIGIVSRDSNTLNFMPSLNQTGYDISIIPVVESELPTDAALLNALDVLVINDTSTSDWNEQKLKAIEDWVRQGGTLVLSGGAGYAKTAAGFAEITPFTATGTTQITNQISVNDGNKTVIKLPTPVTVSTGIITEGNIDQAEGGIPLAISRTVGFGSVKYVAFDPSLEPLATAAGSALFFATLLNDSILPLQPGSIINNSDLYWSLNNLVDRFPSIKPPNMTLLIMMFIGYMVIVAPVLYFLLSKTDRREWSWWLIPCLAVITGISIFYIGAEDKRAKSAHTIEIIELTGQGDAVRSGATAVFIPTGGTVKAEFEEKLNIKPYSENNFQNSGLVLDGNTQVVIGDEKTSMVWRSVPYWSTRKLWMDRRMMETDPGQLTLGYKRLNNDLEVTVKNDTIADLTHVAVLMNGTVSMIGDLKQGESGAVKVNKGSFQQSGFYSYGNMIFQYPSNHMNDEFSRHRELVDTYFNNNNGGIVSPVPMIVGFRTKHDKTFKVNGDRVETDELELWSQRLETTFLDDKRLLIPSGFIRPIIIQNNLQSLNSHGNNMYSFNDGELVFEYQLPNASSVTYDKLDITILNGMQNVSKIISIWNDTTGKWTDIQAAMAAPSEHLIHNEFLRMKVTAVGSFEMSMPLIAVEGEVK